MYLRCYLHGAKTMEDPREAAVNNMQNHGSPLHTRQEISFHWLSSFYLQVTSPAPSHPFLFTKWLVEIETVMHESRERVALAEEILDRTRNCLHHGRHLFSVSITADVIYGLNKQSFRLAQPNARTCSTEKKTNKTETYWRNLSIPAPRYGNYRR
jgi:hypothetical protein